MTTTRISHPQPQSPPRGRPLVRRARLVALAAALPLLSGGCGAGASLAGIHDAPVEQTDAASISPSAGAKVATRVLDAATEARAAKGKDADTARKEALTGPALREARAAASPKIASQATPATSKDDTEVQVLAVSRSTEWPRTMLVTRRHGQVQQLHVLVAESVTEPYRLFASVDMSSGASVPSLGSPTEGTKVTVGTAPATTRERLVGWTKAVAYPAPKKMPEDVSVADDFSTALRSNARQQDRRLKDLGSLTQQQTLTKGDAVTFTLADGGTLSFSALTRTETVEAGRKAKELKLPKDLADLVGKTVVRRSVSTTTAETVALVVPAKGKASVVGASQQLTGAKGE